LKTCHRVNYLLKFKKTMRIDKNLLNRNPRQLQSPMESIICYYPHNTFSKTNRFFTVFLSSSSLPHHYFPRRDSPISSTIFRANRLRSHLHRESFINKMIHYQRVDITWIIFTMANGKTKLVERITVTMVKHIHSNIKQKSENLPFVRRKCRSYRSYDNISSSSQKKLNI